MTVSSPAQRALDEHFMARALELAGQGRYWCSPNPHVGCVLVRGEEVLAEGFTQPPGGAHAEIDALRRAPDCRGATAYVTLEPCSHWGRTGPCVDALLAAGIERVVVAIEDPFPQVAGRGLQRLRDAGVAVEVGLMAEAARREICGFLLRIERGWGRVRLKLAASMDGRTAMASGESQWITSKAARQDVQRLRAQSSFIVTGVGTVLADDCALTVRPGDLGLTDEALQRATQRQPGRVVLDTHGQTPALARVLEGDADTLILHGPHVSDRPWQWAEVCPVINNRLDLQAVVARLGALGGNEILLEAGPTLAGALLQAGLVDEVVLYQAPKWLGSSARPLAHMAIDRLADSIEMDYREISRVGPDLRIIAVPVHRIPASTAS